MTETKSSTGKSPKNPQSYEVADLTTPFASAMKLWQGQTEKVFAQTEQAMARTFEASRKLIEEQNRLALAQMNASQDALRVVTEGMQRMAQTGTES